ncbi:MAG: serine/threonine-protein kinase, partial [Lentisphaerota bacterium]
DIVRGEMTITQFMEKRGIEGGVALDGNKASSTASSVLVDQAGRKYDIGSKLAAGGMGAILQAKDLNIRRTVAMKVLLDPKRSSENQILRFIEEAQITGQLEHPSIVPVHELGVDSGGNVFYTMKFVKGETLDSIIECIKARNAETIAKYPLNTLLNIFLKVCDGMALAHAKGVVHRDLKPANIMIGEFGEVLVMDWGLGKVLGRKEKDQAEELAPGYRTSVESARVDSVSSVSGAMTMEGNAMGTPVYMSPEQAYGRVSEIDQRTDIYALGAILYQILTLHTPVDGDNVNAILMKVAQGQIEEPSKYERIQEFPLHHLPGRRVPPALSHIAMKAMSLEKNARYQTVKELYKDIEAYQGGFATEAENAGLARQLLLLVKRHKGFVTAAAIVLLTVAGGLVVSLIQRDHAIMAKVEAQKQRDAAETAKIEAQNQRDIADKAKAVEQKLREAAEYDAYLGRLSMAQQRIGDFAYDQAEELLNGCPEKYRNWEWRRLKFLCNVFELKFSSAKKASFGSCYSPDGKWIATGSSEWRTLAIWDSKTGELVKKLSSGEGSHIRFNPSGTLLAISTMKEIKIWDIIKDECRQKFSGHTFNISALEFSSDGKKLLSAGGRDGHAMIWSMETGKRLLDWTSGPKSTVEAVAFSPSGDRFIAGGTQQTTSDNKKAWIVNADDGSLIWSFSDKIASCNAVSWTQDGKAVAVAGYGSNIDIYDPETGKLVRGFEPGHNGPIFSICFSNDGKYLLSGSSDRTIKMWDVCTGKIQNTFNGSSNRIREVNWSPDNTR